MTAIDVWLRVDGSINDGEKQARPDDIVVPIVRSLSKDQSTAANQITSTITPSQ